MAKRKPNFKRKSNATPYYNPYLRAARLEKNYTIKYLAEFIGLHPSYLKHIENLRKIPPTKIRKKLSEILEKSIEEIFPQSILDLTQYRGYWRGTYKKLHHRQNGTQQVPTPYEKLKILIPPTEYHKYPLSEDYEEYLGDLIKKATLQLSPRDRQFIELRFSLYGYPNHTLKEIGEMFGITRQNAQYLEVKALKKLYYEIKKYEVQ